MKLIHHSLLLYGFTIFSYFLLGYSLITSTGYCSHTSGGLPTYCYSGTVPSQSNCEGFCSSHASCVGYFHSSSLTRCYVLPSDGTCPSNFVLAQRTDATSANDLVATPSSGYVCYGKSSGKINKHQIAIIYLFYCIS